MYYARRNGVLAECKTWGGWGRTERSAWRKEEGGREKEEGVCVWRVWRPLRRAGGGCQATPFSPHILTPPSTNPKTPFWASPTSPHGVLFLSSDYPTRRACLIARQLSTLILIPATVCDRHSLSFSSFWSFSQRFFLLMDYFKILFLALLLLLFLRFERRIASFFFISLYKRYFITFHSSFLLLFRFDNLLIALSFFFSSVFFSWDDDVSIAPLFVWIFSLLENSSIL